MKNKDKISFALSLGLIMIVIASIASIFLFSYLPQYKQAKKHQAQQNTEK